MKKFLLLKNVQNVVLKFVKYAKTQNIICVLNVEENRKLCKISFVKECSECSLEICEICEDPEYNMCSECRREQEVM